MRDPEFVMYFSIESMQYANEEFTNIAEELPVSIELDVFNDETLRRALQAIADFLDCNSLQCQSVLDASGRRGTIIILLLQVSTSHHHHIYGGDTSLRCD
jgi:hypothetical protein